MEDTKAASSSAPLIFGGIVLAMWIYLAYNSESRFDRCELELNRAEKRLDAIMRERDSLLLCQQYEMYYEN